MKMFKPVSISFLILLSSLIIYSCNSNKIFEKHQEIREMQWAKKDIKTFEIEVDDIEAEYTVSVALRFVEGCPYAGVPVNLSWSDQEGNAYSQIKSIMIRDDNEDYLGSVLGNMYDLNEVVIEGYKFEKRGIYVFELSHFSDYDPMLLLDEIGLIVEKEKE